MSFRTPRASFGADASANGFSDAVRPRPALVARGETPGRALNGFRVARGGYVGGIAFVSFRTPRASFGADASANGLSDAVRPRPALVARGETPGRAISPLLPAFRRADSFVVFASARTPQRTVFILRVAKFG